jgi:hypothetical protein
MQLAAMTETPGVDSALPPVAFVKQGAIRRTEIVNDFAQADPKHIGLEPVQSAISSRTRA